MSPASETRPPVARVATLFSALGDETRLALVARLGEGKALSIAELASGSTVTRQAITKHLNVLAGAGLVRDQRRGREHLWELEVGRVEDARSYLAQISKHWDETLDRLKQLVEG